MPTTDASFAQSVHRKALALTRLSHRMTTTAGSGHPTSAASLAHIVTVLLYDRMRWDPADPGHPDHDRLILSEGHACPIVYAAGADLGIRVGRDAPHPMTEDDALQLRAIDSPIDGHPNPLVGFPFFPTATGSLGQGLSHAAGLAAAARLDGRPIRVYCLLGDGESREGQVWEAAAFVRDQSLRAVCPIFNCNGLGQSEAVSRRESPEGDAARMEASGFEVLVIDGHDPLAIRQALDLHAGRMNAGQGKPVAIVARTVKGWGTPSMQGNGHHGKPAQADDLPGVLDELEATGRELGVLDAAELEFTPDRATPPRAVTSTGRVAELPGFREALKRFGKPDVLQAGRWPTRKAFGLALQVLGHARDDVVVLDGDVKNSTYTEDFADDPELAPRFLEGRIAEQNMVSVAAGLSSGGKLPFVSSFAKFLTRAYDQIEMALVGGANLKLVGSHAGVSLAADGPSQMALPDVAWFRAWTTMRDARGQPGVVLLMPSDAWSAYALTLTMAAHQGACMLRTLRPATPLLYKDDDAFPLGGHKVLTEGGDLLVLAQGYMVSRALEARRRLEQEGIATTVVDCYSLPFDEQAVVDLAREHHGAVLTLEDNYGGGLGSAVAEAVAASGEAIRVQPLHVRRVPKSGRTPEDVLAYCGLSTDAVVAAAHGLLETVAS